MTRRRLAAALLGLGAAAYALAAWAVAPGFYDGFQTVTPYRWVSPPPNLAANNKQPLAGHSNIAVVGSSGTVALTAFTGDGQMVLGFVPDSFQLSPGQQSVSVDIKPVAAYPRLTFTPATNVYLVTTNAPLKKQAVVELQYSNMVPAPSYVYEAQAGGSWRNLGASQVSAIYSISTRTSTLGYFAAGYGAGKKPPPGSVQVGGGQTLPIIVAAIILLVLIAGVPLALLRRGRGDEEDEEPAGG